MMDITVHGVKKLSLSIRENNSSEGGRVHMCITDSYGTTAKSGFFHAILNF